MGNTLTKQSLVELERGQWQAMVDGDVDYYRHLLTDDFMAVMGEGVMDTQMTVDMMSDRPTSFRYEMDDPTELELSEDSALLTYRAHFEGDHKGEHFSQDAYFTTIYVRREGQWRAAFSQMTPAQPETVVP